ncbi:MAG TPA: hypothetical protein VFX37_15180 [Pseudolabrys sp.]|nr:hypothetical protein [Pseudolabrys sp.]
MAELTDIDDSSLIDALHATCCSSWHRAEIAEDKLLRFAQTYLMMASCSYRPGAPSDGFGNICLAKEELADRARLYDEAAHYAARFEREEDKHSFSIGCSNFSTNRAFILAIEAARLLGGGSGGNVFAIKLLRLAIKEIKDAEARRRTVS